MAGPLQIRGVIYHGGFPHLGLTEARRGRLTFSDDAITLDLVQNVKATPDYKSFEVCRTRAIASVEVTSEQVAKSKLGAAALFGILGAVTAKGSQDRATLLVTLKNGEIGYLTVAGMSSPALLGTLSPWLNEHGIAIGTTRPPPLNPRALSTSSQGWPRSTAPGL